MNHYRKPLNVVLALWIVSILLGFVSPFLDEEDDQLKDAQSLKVQVELLKNKLDEKKSSESVSDAEYSRLNDEISTIDKKVDLIIESKPRDERWNWYSNLVVPVCSLIVVTFGLYINNRTEEVAAQND